MVFKFDELVKTALDRLLIWQMICYYVNDSLLDIIINDELKYWWITKISSNYQIKSLVNNIPVIWYTNSYNRRLLIFKKWYHTKNTIVIQLNDCKRFFYYTLIDHWWSYKCAHSKLVPALFTHPLGLLFVHTQQYGLLHYIGTCSGVSDGLTYELYGLVIISVITLHFQ